jgi:uncharacterized protein YjbI with pentapeptide repeats
MDPRDLRVPQDARTVFLNEPYSEASFQQQSLRQGGIFVHSGYMVMSSQLSMNIQQPFSFPPPPNHPHEYEYPKGSYPMNFGNPTPLPAGGSKCGGQSPDKYRPSILSSPTVPGFYTTIDLDTNETEDHINRAVAPKIWQTDPAEWYCSEPGVPRDELQRRKQHYQAYKDSMMALKSQQTSGSQRQLTSSNGSAMPPQDNYLNAQHISVSSQGSNFSSTEPAHGSNTPAPGSSPHMVQPNQNFNQTRREGMGFDQSLNSNGDFTNTNLDAIFGTGAPLSQENFSDIDFSVDMFNSGSPIDESNMDEAARLGEAYSHPALQGEVAGPQMEDASFDWDDNLNSLEANSQNNSGATLP